MALRIFRSLNEARGNFGPCALSIGNFDGVHLGHQSLFREVTSAARSAGLAPSVLTFDPHPTKVVAPDRAPKLLSTIEERCRWMEPCGITQVMILPFSRDVANLSPEEFVQCILVDTLQTRAVLVGENFRFGRGQAGDVATLQRLGQRDGFTMRAVVARKAQRLVISSSGIRKCILAGNVAQAARMLGRFYAIEGIVVRGHGVGARQTVPTLNLSTTAEVLPAVGVYVSRTFDLDGGRDWPSISNIGFRPTFGGEDLTIESYLLQPLEGEPPARIRLEFTHRLRDERRFADAVLLREQILRDVDRAMAWHRRWKRWRVKPVVPPVY